MSFDLAVWYSNRPLSTEEAVAVYSRLGDGGAVAQVEAHPSLDACYRDLTARHPELDDVPESEINNTDLCPWSAAIERSDGYLILSTVWSKAAHVLGLVRILGQKHGVTVFDPQTGILYPPTRDTRSLLEGEPQGHLILELGCGTRLEQPDLAAIHGAIWILDSGENSFAIISRSDETYLQTACGAPGQFVVEYREGNETRHFQTVRKDLGQEEVADLFLAYSLDRPDWKGAHRWEPLESQPPKQGCGGLFLAVSLLAVALGGGLLGLR